MTVPNLSGIPWRFCSRSDEQPAGALGKSLLRLGVCLPEDWSGSAVDFVERGYKRFCAQNGIKEAGNVWKGNLRIMDTLFDMTELEYQNACAERPGPPDTLFVVGDYEQAASIPIGATLPHLEREHPKLPLAFYTVFVHCLQKWMRVYDYTDACCHAEMMMDGAEPEDLKDSYLPQIAKSIPSCLPKPPADCVSRSIPRAVAFLQATCGALKGDIARRLVEGVLELHREAGGYRHAWPSALVQDVPGLEEFLSDADSCGPGCAITWYEDDAIAAAFDEEMQYLGQNGPMEPAVLMRFKLHSKPDRMDREVRKAFDYLGAMLRSLKVAAHIVELIRDIFDEYLRQHRKKSGLQAEPRPSGIRQE